MDGVRPAKRGRRRLAEPERPDLALLAETRHRAHRLLDRDLRIHPVLVVEIDRLDAEPLQAGLAGAADVGGAPVHQVAAAVRAPHLAELRGEDDAVTSAGERPPEGAPRCAPSRTCRRSPGSRPPGRGRGGSPRSRPRRRSCRTCLTSTCSRGRSPTPSMRRARAAGAPSMGPPCSLGSGVFSVLELPRRRSRSRTARERQPDAGSDAAVKRVEDAAGGGVERWRAERRCSGALEHARERVGHGLPDVLDAVGLGDDPDDARRPGPAPGPAGVPSRSPARRAVPDGARGPGPPAPSPTGAACRDP